MSSSLIVGFLTLPLTHKQNKKRILISLMQEIHSRSQASKKSKKSKLIFCWIPILVLCDQLAKFWARNFLTALGEPRVVIPSFFELELVFNSGAAFGFFSEQIYLLTAVSSIFSFVLFLFMLKNFSRLDQLSLIALILVLAGALGNLLDRFYFQRVTDFIKILTIPNFNLADALINFGFVVYLGSKLKNRKIF